MEDLQSQIDDINNSLDDTSSTLEEQSSVLDDHEGRISTSEDTLGNINPDMVGQLDFPLNQDSIDRIVEVIGNKILTGQVALVGGTATVTDTRILTTSIIVVTPTTSSSSSAYRLAGVCNAGSATIFEGSFSQTSTVNYFIYL